LSKLESEKGIIFFLSLSKHKQMAGYSLMNNPEEKRHLCFTSDEKRPLASGDPV
jgi:hypothetical protein